MSIELVAAALKANIRPASHKLAVVMLAEGTNSKTGIVWRARSSIAACCGMEPRAAHRMMQSLIGEGIVSVVGERSGGSRGAVNVYRVNLARLLELAPSVIHTDGLQATPTGDIQATGAGPEGWPTGAVRGGLQATQTGSESQYTATAVDNPASVAHVEALAPHLSQRLAAVKAEVQERRGVIK